MINARFMMILLATAIFLFPLASAQLIVPHQFYGDVVINGEPAPNNLELEARVNGQLYGATFTSGGTYGYNPNIFYVEYQGSDGAEITFFIEGQEVATHSFQSGQSTRLDFDAEIEGVSSGDDSGNGESGDDSSDDSGSGDSGTGTGGSGSGGAGGGGGGVATTGTTTTDDDSEETTSGDGSSVVDSCTPNWICTQWAECVNNIQRRTCIDTNECGDESSMPDTRMSCEQTTEEIYAAGAAAQPSGNFLTGLVTGLGDGEYSRFALYGLLLAMLIGMLIFFVFKRRK